MIFKKLNAFSLLAMFLLAPPSLLLSQDKNQQETSRLVQSESPIIEVSEQLFSGIEMWLSKGNEDIPLDKFLLNEGIDTKEVESFKEQHVNGLGHAQNKYKSNGGTQSSNTCVCNAVMPSSLVNRYHSSPHQAFDRFYDGPQNPFQYKWRANEKRWTNDGLSTDFYIRAHSHDRHSIRNDNQNGGGRLQIINLCSDAAFLRDDLCNCDKFIEYEGEFRNHFETKLDAKFGTMFPSRSRLAFQAAYIIYKSEYDPNSTINPSKSEFLDSANWKVSGEHMWTIDWSQVADAGVNLLEAVVNVVDSNYADVPGNFSDFFDNLDSVVDTHIMNGDYNSFNVRPFSGWDTLKANIPQYFVGAHAYSGVVETSGRKENNAQIEYRSAFYWTFKVANTNQGYNIDGIPQGSFSQCCNEDLAIWDFHNAVQSTALNGGIEDMANNMEESLNFTLLGGKYFNFQNTSHGPSLLQDGFINIRDNESLYASSSSGRAYTLSQCGCESFLTQRETLGGELILDFLTPNLSLEPDRLCPGNTPQLRILNASALEISDTCDLEIKISHETQGLMRTFVANGSNISLNLNIPGVYTVSYVNSCTGCVVSSQIELKECIENEQLECIWNKFNIFPNSLSVNWENLTIKACLEDCLDDPSDTVALAQLHNQYFPVTFTIRNIQGNLTFGPQQNVLQSASLNNFNCYEEIIDLTDASLGNFPFPAGLYLVIIQFANGQSKTRMLRII